MSELPRAQRLYTPTWWERRFPWILDVLIALDPDPLGRRLRPVARALMAPVEAVCTPLAAGIGRVDAVVRRARRRRPRATRPTARALPLPGPVQDWLWLRPLQLDRIGQPSAQALWRARARRITSVGLGLAVVAHVALFALWPTMTVEETVGPSAELAAIDIPPEVVVPPAPEAIPRPAVPVMATTPVAEDLTISPTTFEDNPVTALPPPPAERVEVSRTRPTITPFTVAPEILNPTEVRALLIAEYPPPLRDAGIGGQVVMWIYLDDRGAIGDMRIAQGSGHESLDAAAFRVAEKIRFSPALNRDERVATWVQFPIVFSVR